MGSVFECSITTIFVCCFHDNDMYEGRHMPAKLRKAFGLPKAEESKSINKDEKGAAVEDAYGAAGEEQDYEALGSAGGSSQAWARLDLAPCPMSSHVCCVVCSGLWSLGACRAVPQY